MLELKELVALTAENAANAQRNAPGVTARKTELERELFLPQSGADMLSLLMKAWASGGGKPVKLY